MSKALIPGSYDPITNGHLDIIRRCSKLFDEVTVLVSKNSQKNYMLCSKSRAALCEDAVKDLKNVTVYVYDGLLADYVNLHGIDVTVKGLRNETDFSYEQNMAYTNRQLSKSMYSYDFETLYMPCSKEFSDVSSSLVRLLISHNADISTLVPNSTLLLKLINE